MNIFKLTFSVILFGLILSGSLHKIYAQSERIKFAHITTLEGLSYFGVSLIFQDSKGFMWFGSTVGLDRFDGYNFTFYSHFPIRSNSTMIEDKQGFLWTIVDGGTLYRFDRSGNKFKSYPFSKKVRRILEDKNGDIWLSTEGDGLGRYIHSKDSVIIYKHHSYNSNSISDDYVNVVFEDRQGKIWVGTNQGINIFDRTKESFNYINLDSSPYINSFAEDNNNIWIGSSEGLYKLNKTNKTFRHFKNINRQHDYIYNVFRDSKNVLWIRNEGGISAFDKTTEKFSNFEHIKGVASYTTMAHNPFFEDKTGRLWSLDGGHLTKFNPILKKFELIMPAGPDSIVDYVVMALFEDRVGTLWFGTSSGIDKLDKIQKPFIKVWDNLSKIIHQEDIGSMLEDNNGTIWLQTRKGLYHLGRNTNKYFFDCRTIALDMIEDPPGSLWLTTWGDGLINFDIGSHKFSYFRNDYSDFQSISDNSVNSMITDKNGIMWIGTMNGKLERFDRINKTFSHFVYDSIPYPGISPHNTGLLCRDRYSNIWICARGLVVFNIENHSFKFFHYDSTNSGSLSSDEVFSIYEDSKGTLWLGTSTGLNRFNRESNTFTCINVKNGLASDFIKGILEDDGEGGEGKCLWLLTLKGISKYNPVSGTIKNYGPEDGVTISASLTGHSFFKSRNGELYFGSKDGIIKFNPKDIKDNPYVPPVVITSFRKFGKEARLDSSITEKKQIDLSYDENNISFEFAALNYSSPQSNQYAYKMEGVDKDWIYSGSRRYASYPNLDPGKYIFKVKGSNNDGIWNEKGISIVIIISSPWWKTWWAYSFYSVVFIFTLYGIRRYELNRLKLKDKIKMDENVLKEKEETEKMKSRFFANISHEFRTPLTLILGPAEKISLKTSNDVVKDANIIKRNSRRLLQLINQLLDLSKLEVGKLKLEASRGNIVSFVKGVVLSFESLSESKDINLKINADEEYIELYFDKEKMMKILTNILSNAFKFTPEAGTISVSIRENPTFNAPTSKGGKNSGSVEIKIRDTGIGIAQEEIPKLFDRFYQMDSSYIKEYEGTGIGLALTKELVELHHGRISVESEKDIWTEFTMEFPLSRDFFSEEEIAEEKELKEDVILNKIKHITDSSQQNPLNDVDRNGNKSIILIVEDNYDMRQYIRESLDGSHLVEEAINGEQGVKKAKKIIPDLIISDLMMPKMDGNELVKILKNDEITSHIPIILLTAKAGQEFKLEGLETGADDYLIKPFDIKELQIRIKNLINIRKNIQEKFNRINSRLIEVKDNKLKSMDEKFMLRVIEVIEKHISEEEFGMDEFAEELGMSRMQVHRKLKALTGKSANRYIRSIKLDKGKKMIEAKEGNISEIAYSLGFGSPTYFTKCFKEEFGYLPSDHQF